MRMPMARGKHPSALCNVSVSPRGYMLDWQVADVFYQAISRFSVVPATRRMSPRARPLLPIRCSCQSDDGVIDVLASPGQLVCMDSDYLGHDHVSPLLDDFLLYMMKRCLWNLWLCNTGGLSLAFGVMIVRFTVCCTTTLWKSICGSTYLFVLELDSRMILVILTSLHKIHRVHTSKPSSNTTLLALVTLRAEQIPSILIVQDLFGLLVPHTSTISTQLTDHTTLFQLPIP